MAKQPFTNAADSHGSRILNAIRAPEQEPLTAYYVAHKSKEVAEALLKFAREGEADAVVSFITSDASRFSTLGDNGQIGALMDALEQLDGPRRFKVISTTESYLYGTPNATVLQEIVKTRDEDIVNRLTGMLRSFDNEQRTGLFSAPGAAWWVSCYDQVPLLYEMLAPLSRQQRQEIYGSSPTVDHAIRESCCPELTELFKDCKPAQKPSGAPKP